MFGTRVVILLVSVMVVASFSISGVTAYQTHYKQPKFNKNITNQKYGNIVNNSTSPAKPIVNNTTTPVVNTTKPTTNTTTPIINTTKPTTNTTTPIINTTKPTTNTTTPIVNSTKPITNTTTPIANTTIPVVNSTSPLTGTIVKVGSSIQSAINNAKIGDTIIVDAGVYNENLDINKAISLIANGTVNIGSVSISANNVTVQGFTITAPYAVVVNSNNVEILNNVITSSLNGIMDEGTVLNLVVKGNTLIGTNSSYGNNIAFEGVTNDAQILNNTLSGAEFGMLFDVASTDNLISGNTIYGNGYLVGTGIYTVDGSTNFTILNNTIMNTRDSIAVQQIGTAQASGFLIQGNIIENSYDACWMAVDNSLITGNTFLNLVDAVDLTGTGNTISNNIFTNSSNCDVALTTKLSSDLNTLINNTFNGLKNGKYYNVGPGSVVGE